MNWVGGSRNRLVMKNDARKQREFFEKRKLQQKLKHLGLPLPASPGPTNTCGSMDLVNLFIVNQIAAKKENKDSPKVSVFGSKKSRADSLVLPMSPCSPSQLSFVESQPRHSVQGARKRNHFIPEGFKCGQLSPVMESAFSDLSASDYVPPISDPLSPFSSISSSSGQGKFHLQLNPQTPLSPGLWDTSGLERAEFQPFSQSRDMTDSITWSHGANLPIHLETPTAAQTLFRSPDPNNRTRNHARHEVSFCLGQTGMERQFEGDVFRAFATDKHSHFGSEKTRISLKDDVLIKSSAPQTVPDSLRTGAELSNCTDMDFSCLEHHSVPLNGCDCTPSYSCSGGYLSSQSDDHEDCWEPCVQAASSYMDQACCAESLETNLGPRENPKQQPRPFNLLLKPKINSRDDQKVMEDVVRTDRASGSSSQQMGSCITSRESRDAGTQTVTSHTVKTREASTQCCFFGGDGASKDVGLDSCLPPVEVSVQDPASGGRTNTTAQPHTPTSGKALSRGSEKKSRAGSPLDSSIVNTSEGRFLLQRPENPFLDPLCPNTDGRDSYKSSREGSRWRKWLSDESETGGQSHVQG